MTPHLPFGRGFACTVLALFCSFASACQGPRGSAPAARSPVPGVDPARLPPEAPPTPRPPRAAPRLGLAPSFLPNLGVQATVDWPVARTDLGDWRIELQLVDQFLDDETFSKDGNPPAGNWTQLALAARLVRSPGASESVEWFAGPIFFHARGKPNLVELPGSYLGLRAGVGYQVRLSRGLVMGPEIALVIAHSSRDTVLFGQVAWGVRWALGRD
ncbi:MAG TPA: hypothetical protein ENJ09_05580 [Planctomycetes bacterium]|nr:hypothetical protein [Planctomycetota bacterium]